MVKAPKSSHITPILRSLHWLKINERIEYKLLSLTYKVLTTSQPDYLHNLISVHSTCRTRSSSLVTLARPSLSYSSQVTNRSFRYASVHHLTCGISSLLHSVNLIVFTLLLVHLILRISPHHSQHFRSHHLSLLSLSLQTYNSSFPQILSSNLLVPPRLPSRILNLYWTNWALAFFRFSFVC